MHRNHRMHSLVWLLVLFVFVMGMSCSVFSGRIRNSGAEGEQVTPPPMPTTEGLTRDHLPMPLPQDAANVSSSQESFSYTTQLSVDDVAKFYQENLPPLGWTIEEHGNMAGTLMWTVSRQDVTYLLNVMPSNGMTIVNAAPIK